MADAVETRERHSIELDFSKIAAKGFPQPISRVYLFQGGDDAIKQEAVARLTEPLLDPGFADFDREERDVPTSGGEGGLARQILASAGGAPMASARRVVVVSNVQRLSKEEQESLAAGLDTLGALSCLVLITGAPEYDAGKVKAKSVAGTKLVNAIGKAGAVVLCDSPPVGDLKARALTLLKARSKTIEPGAWEMIMARAKAATEGGKTGDVHVMINELEKAIAYAGDRKQITVEDAAATGMRGIEENIFSLLDAVGHRNARKALDQTDELLRAGDKPDAVAARTFVMLARHLRQVWGAKYLAERRVGGGGALPPDVQAVLSGGMVGLTMRQSYLLRGLQEQARGWSYEQLGRGLGRVLASDMAMKGIAPITELGTATVSSDDPASNLRLLVVDLCR